MPVSSPAWKIDWVFGDRFELSTTSIAAISGYPSVTVPGGQIKGLPVGIAIVGRPGSEDKLVKIAAAFEAARGDFAAPRFLPILEK